MSFFSNSEKKRPEGLERGSKSTTQLSLTFRAMGRMGQSMSSLTKSKVENELPMRIVETIPSEQALEVAEKNLLSDIQNVRVALDLFLNSRITEARDILEPKKSATLYHALGHSFILFLKSVMTFQKVDIEEAIEALKETIQLADGFRKKKKKESGWLGNITSWVKGITVQDVSNMTSLQRHAELVYAESYLLKALLCIIHDESFVSFLREGLHVRTSYNTYKILQRFLVQLRDEAIVSGSNSCDTDDHFTSGVSLGIGLFNIVISLLPTSVVKIVEFIGFTSDRTYGMEMLETAGGWEAFNGLPPSELPELQDTTEGLRRQFCDMVLLFYHIILPKLIPISDANPDLADRILAYSLKLYPQGVFFLYFSGRQLATRSELEKSKLQYQQAIDTQKDWRQLQHMCYWELGLISILTQEWNKAYQYYVTLQKESNWSKAVYYYLQAISLYIQSGTNSTPEQQKLFNEAIELMQKVSGSRKKIAGKSIPLEKFIARKARKFLAQNNRLLLPDLEVANALNIFEFMTLDLLYKNLERVNQTIHKLTEDKHEEVLNYHDDFCLAHYLRTVILRLILTNDSKLNKESAEEFKKSYQQSIQHVLDDSDKIQLDHYIYYFARYEQARMLIFNRNYTQAKEIIQSIIKLSEKGQYGIGAGPHAKNKYSQENTILFKCHNCLTEIEELSKA